MEGSLSKWTNVMKGWQYRWFVLDDNAGILSYYTSREKMVRGIRRGCVRLKGAVIGIDDQDKTTFTITVDGKTFHFQARNSMEREKWVRCLEDTIVKHAQGYNTGSYVAMVDGLKLSPTLQDFDKKVSEADAYLQLLIDQVKDLENKKETLPTDSDKESCNSIIKNTNIMLEQVKHTIVLLQIAKNSAFPVNGTYPTQRQRPSSCSLPSDVMFADSKNGGNISDLMMQRPEKKRLSAYRLSESSSSYRTDVPAVSYSSSEDEDFFDACETNTSCSEDSANGTKKDESYRRHSVPDSNTSGRRDSSSTVNTANEENSRRDSAPVIEMSGSASVPTLPDGSVDYDALYEDPTEPDVETQPSVIKHLISQVKIGMDLTKVVLPTFILERRSLLEMYSDYFAHPDIFLKAVDLPTPQERMVQIVKWYLSSYHAGRKSSVAKKPYNPILGEIFRCWWDVKEDASGCDEEEAEDQKEEQNCNTAHNDEEMLNKDGPVPWCRKDQLVFLAEQVSHHPPISAFYAEHAKKRVSLCAHIWTKSKFLGLSVGVHNIGQAVVRLLNHKEEYISTFPNGYGRSILTVPWIELGGTTYIKCPQTGYYCNIEFITKPFYGGKRHRIMAEVFSPKEKKPFLTVSGEWNGVMEAKWADGSSEVFIDTRKLNVIKKKVKSVTEQQDNESRKIWKSVTLGLRYNDIDQATHAKMQIEQKQRDEAKTRKEKNEAWEPKFFYEQDGAWIYKNPLEKRLGIELESDLSLKS